MLLEGYPEGVSKEAFDEQLGGSLKPQKCGIFAERQHA